METKIMTNENNSTFLIRNKELKIDNLSVSFKDKTLFCADIDRIKYGSIQMYVNGIKANKIYQIFLLDKSGNKLNITFQRFWIKTKDGETLFQDIINALWKFVTSKIVDKMLQDLKTEKTVEVGNIAVNKTGISIKVWRWLKFKYEEVFIPWSSCLKQIANGGFIISSKSNKRDKRMEKFLSVWNLNALHSVLNFLWEEGRCFKLEKGELK